MVLHVDTVIIPRHPHVYDVNIRLEGIMLEQLGGFVYRRARLLLALTVVALAGAVVL